MQVYQCDRDQEVPAERVSLVVDYKCGEPVWMYVDLCPACMRVFCELIWKEASLVVLLPSYGKSLVDRFLKVV